MSAVADRLCREIIDPLAEAYCRIPQTPDRAAGRTLDLPVRTNRIDRVTEWLKRNSWRNRSATARTDQVCTRERTESVIRIAREMS